MAQAVSPTYLPGGSISPCRFVKIVSQNTVNQATNGTNDKGDVVVGIAQEGTGSWNTTTAATANTQIRVFGPGEVALVECGGTVGNGVYVKADANGKAIVCNTTGDYGVGFSLQNGVANSKIMVFVHPMTYAVP